MNQNTVDDGSHAICTPFAGHGASRLMEAEEITVSFYGHDAPAFIESELERLYENIFSSLAKFRIDGNTGNPNVYMVRKGGRITTILLFLRKNDKVEVINQAIRLDEEDIRRFSDAIFSTFRLVTFISFHAIQTAIQRLPYPYQKFNCLEDIVLALPGSQQEYFGALGKNMRADIKRYTKKLDRSFPSFSYEIYVKEGVSEHHIRDIVNLSSARMAVKNKVSLHDEKKTEQLIHLVKAYGLVGVATIDGRVCGGVICSRFGSNYFMHVIAHNPQYDDYRLGKLCCYWTICECIDRGGKEFHFLWGRYEYKYKLLGVQRDLDRIAVYRSRAHWLLKSRIALQIAYRGYGRQVKRWLLDPKRMNSFMARFATKVANGVRNLKLFRPGFLPKGK